MRQGGPPDKASCPGLVNGERGQQQQRDGHHPSSTPRRTGGAPGLLVPLPRTPHGMRMERRDSLTGGRSSFVHGGRQFSPPAILPSYFLPAVWLGCSCSGLPLFFRGVEICSDYSASLSACTVMFLCRVPSGMDGFIWPVLPLLLLAVTRDESRRNLLQLPVVVSGCGSPVEMARGTCSLVLYTR
ncbi:hypothetical protein PAHAL_1G273600 [Panicum hallii]|jgi:hypothetical protein|uniref:Uncharacterized protein n=1 Tax=Panicum hallii TaxID=206008 RepID=A0A2S3GQ17_9POAL|nr:hypothetical protein PAHAL_1G273600 [Panicum hallii]